MDASKPTDSTQPSTTARRRSSNTLFQGLMDNKRSDATAARRQSLHDQRPEPGMFGKMWRDFTQGSSGSPPK